MEFIIKTTKEARDDVLGILGNRDSMDVFKAKTFGTHQAETIRNVAIEITRQDDNSYKLSINSDNEDVTPSRVVTQLILLMQTNQLSMLGTERADETHGQILTFGKNNEVTSGDNNFVPNF